MNISLIERKVKGVWEGKVGQEDIIHVLNMSQGRGSPENIECSLSKETNK